MLFPCEIQLEPCKASACGAVQKAVLTVFWALFMSKDPLDGNFLSRLSYRRSGGDLIAHRDRSNYLRFSRFSSPKEHLVVVSDGLNYIACNEQTALFACIMRPLMPRFSDRAFPGRSRIDNNETRAIGLLTIPMDFGLICFLEP